MALEKEKRLMRLEMKECRAEFKPLYAKYPTRCPLLALPGSDYCPLHLILVKRMEARRKIKSKGFKGI